MARIGPHRCRHCGCPIRQTGGGGRPRLYCTRLCRDAAMEVRYLDRYGRRRSHKRSGRITTSPFRPLLEALLRPLDSTGPEAEPDVGTAAWFDRHRLY